MKRKIFIVGTLIMSLGLFLAGCGSKKSTEKTAKPEVLPSALSLINDSTKKQAAHANYHIDFNTTRATGDQTVVIEYDTSYAPGDAATAGDYQVTVNDKAKEKLAIYLSETNLYVKDKAKWVDATSEIKKLGTNIDTISKTANVAYLKKLPKQITQTAKVSDEFGKYTVKMGVSGAAADVLYNNQNSTSSTSKNTVESVSYTYVVDKKSKLPISLERETKMDVSGKTYTETVSVDYSDWGKAAVEVPKF